MPTFAHAGADIHDELAGDSGPPVLLLTGHGVIGERQDEVNAALLAHLARAA